MAVLLSIVFVVLYWRKIAGEMNWQKGELHNLYCRLLRKEKVQDPEIKNKDVILLSRKRLGSTDFLKSEIIVLETVKIVLYTLILSFFVSALGNLYSMKLSLFILFVLIGLTSSRSLLSRSISIIKKLSRIDERRASWEKESWQSFISAFLTYRGLYYFTFFLPAVLSAIVSLAVILGLLAAFVGNLVSAMQVLSPILLAEAVLFVVALFSLAVVDFTYPFYIAVKLLQQLRSNLIRGKTRAENARSEQIKILPCPYSCLLMSIAVIYFAIATQYTIPSITLFGQTTTDELLVYGMIISFFMIWVRTLWKRRRGYYVQISQDTEKKLATLMTVWSAPIYYFLFTLNAVLMLGGLIMLSIAFACLRILFTTEHNGMSELLPATIPFIALCLYSVFLMPEYAFVSPLIIIEICLISFLLVPDRLMGRFARTIPGVKVVEKRRRIGKRVHSHML